jgi:LacI family gluconate utilization system Gnt-I transcriptional repressor
MRTVRAVAYRSSAPGERYASAIRITTEDASLPIQAPMPRVQAMFATKPSAVKITDVAIAAGVAPMTVSRVLNTPERVSADTAIRVREAIARLGYVPNMIAGGLSSRRSRMVAAIVPTIAHPMFSEVVQNFTAKMRAAGYQVMLSLSGYGEANEEELVRALLGRRPDGLLLTGAERTPAARRLLADSGIPVVEIWDVADQPTDMLVGFDHVDVGATVAAYFIARGHDRFAAFAADDSRALTRRQGFTDAVRRAGLTVVADTVIPAPSTITSGRQALRAMLPALDRRTALFCSSDMLAFGAIVEAALHGIAVPDRLAVCGFGNFELSQTVEPPFTTVNVEGGLIGRNAADFLLARFAGQGGAQQVRVPFKIVERAST